VLCVVLVEEVEVSVTNGGSGDLVVTLSQLAPVGFSSHFIALGEDGRVVAAADEAVCVSLLSVQVLHALLRVPVIQT